MKVETLKDERRQTIQVVLLLVAECAKAMPDGKLHWLDIVDVAAKVESILLSQNQTEAVAQ